MDTIKDKVEELISAIRESTEYRNFQEAEQQVIRIPGLEEKIREYCWKNYEIQNSSSEDFSDRIEEFENQYRELREHPVVAQYLESELGICRMLQKINAEITKAVELMI